MKETRPFALLVAALATVVGAGAAVSQTETASAAEKVDIPFEKTTLKNGLEVILHEDHRTPFVAVSVWYHVGAINEVKGRTGFAHLFEHLMFQGTPNVGDDNHIAFLEQAGASVRAGMVNGTTNEDRTNYFAVVPANELELALWLESDRMGYLMAGMTKEKLDEQRDVVKNERLQGVDNAPYGLAAEALWQKMFPAEHPYWGMVIGSLADLDAATMDDVGSFYDAYYAPSNATVAITGDFKPEEAKALLEKYFGTLPPWEKPVTREIPVPAIKGPVRIDFDEKQGKLAQVKIAYFTPAFFQPGDADLDVLSHVLSSGKSSRLYRTLVDEMQVAQSVSAHQMSMGNVSVFEIEIMVRDGKNPEEALETTLAIIEEFGDLPPEEGKIVEAVNAIETSRLFGLQKIGSFSGKSELLQTYNHYVGDPGFVGKDLERYRQVTPDSIAAVIKAHLTPDKRAVLVAKPAVAAPTAAPAAEGGAQ
jgi:zinc protease